MCKIRTRASYKYMYIKYDKNQAEMFNRPEYTVFTRSSLNRRKYETAGRQKGLAARRPARTHSCSSEKHGHLVPRYKQQSCFKLQV